jgi:hypothetical protein
MTQLMVAVNYVSFYFCCFYVSMLGNITVGAVCAVFLPLGEWTVNAYSETLGGMKIYNFRRGVAPGL